MINRSIISRLLPVLAFVGFLVASASPVSAAIYNAANDFSTSSNPNSPWTFGSSTTLGGTFVPYVSPGTIGPFDAWGNAPGTNPSVFHNSSAGTVTFLSITLFGNELALHPGEFGEYSIVRFTAPVSDVYTLTGSFGGRDTTTTDIHILLNNVVGSSGSINFYLDSILLLDRDF